MGALLLARLSERANHYGNRTFDVSASLALALDR